MFVPPHFSNLESVMAYTDDTTQTPSCMKHEVHRHSLTAAGVAEKFNELSNHVQCGPYNRVESVYALVSLLEHTQGKPELRSDLNGYQIKGAFNAIIELKADTLNNPEIWDKNPIVALRQYLADDTRLNTVLTLDYIKECFALKVSHWDAGNKLGDHSDVAGAWNIFHSTWAVPSDRDAFKPLIGRFYSKIQWYEMFGFARKILEAIEDQLEIVNEFAEINFGLAQWVFINEAREFSGNRSFNPDVTVRMAVKGLRIMEAAPMLLGSSMKDPFYQNTLVSLTKEVCKQQRPEAGFLKGFCQRNVQSQPVV